MCVCAHVRVRVHGLEEAQVYTELHLSLEVVLTNATQPSTQHTLSRDGQRMNKDKNRTKESLTVSVLRVCQFTSLVVFLRRLLISAECRLQFYCQHWWKEEREREREGKLYSCQERGICDRSRVVPNAGAKHGDSQSSCLLTHVFAAGPLAAEPGTRVQWTTVDKRGCSEKFSISIVMLIQSLILGSDSDQIRTCGKNISRFRLQWLCGRQSGNQPVKLLHCQPEISPSAWTTIAPSCVIFLQ